MFHISCLFVLLILNLIKDYSGYSMETEDSRRLWLVTIEWLLLSGLWLFPGSVFVLLSMLCYAVIGLISYFYLFHCYVDRFSLDLWFCSCGRTCFMGLIKIGLGRGLILWSLIKVNVFLFKEDTNFWVCSDLENTCMKHLWYFDY